VEISAISVEAVIAACERALVEKGGGGATS
jgi:hypothetical protein